MRIVMWIKLLLSKWVLGAGAAALVVFIIWNGGRSYGFDSGFKKAEGIYLGKVEQAIRSTVDDRDQLWNEKVAGVFGDLKDVFEKNNATSGIEANLAKSLSELRDEIEKISSAIPSANLGGCSLTPNIDSLLNDQGNPDT